jgi:hypothetical protein
LGLTGGVAGNIERKDAMTVTEVRVDRLRDLRDVVDTTPDEKFYMGYWGHYCGSACCAAGNYAHAYPEAAAGLWNAPNEVAYLATHFGITLHESYWMFTPNEYFPRPPIDIADHMKMTRSITRAQVIARIDALLAKYEPEQRIEMKPDRQHITVPA